MRLPLTLILLICLLVPVTACRKAVPDVTEIDAYRLRLWEPKVDYPYTITFSLDAESSSPITRLALQYRLSRLTSIPVTCLVFPEFESGEEVSATWEWDTRYSGTIPPGTRIEYWWSIDDSDGNHVDTEMQVLQVVDSNHEWDNASSDRIDLYWYRGRSNFAEALLAAGEEALDRLYDDVGIQLGEKARVYIYGDSEALQAAMVYPQEWTGGVTYAEYGTILIGIDPSQLQWGKSALAHELSHLVIHRLVYSGYNVPLPTWLDEGLAVNTEGGLNDTLAAALATGIEKGSLFSLRSLAATFPTDRDQAYLAYAQSYSVVRFLLTKVPNGKHKMLDFLESFKDGLTYEQALQNIYGVTVDELDSSWHQYVINQSRYTLVSVGAG